MNAVDLFVNSYKKLFDSHMPAQILLLVRFVHRSIANFIIPISLKRNPHFKQREKIPNLIVSFTSFPARIDKVWLVVECMLRQTILPEKIILWLSKEQFHNEDDIPESLKKRQNEVFEIRLVDGDIRSHKKYYYVMKEYPKCMLFLVDDDIFYSSDILERSYNEYLRGESQVICNYGYLIQYDEKKNMLPYRNWKRIVEKNSSPFLFFGSGGGTLINVSQMPELTTEIETALKLAPKADDIWLNAMVRLSRMHITMLDNGSLLLVKNKHDERLAASNVYDNENDTQLLNLVDYLESTISFNPFTYQYCNGSCNAK